MVHSVCTYIMPQTHASYAHPYPYTTYPHSPMHHMPFLTHTPHTHTHPCIICPSLPIHHIPTLTHASYAHPYPYTKLRRVHRAAARLIGGFRKFDHLPHYRWDVLHWLPFPQRISYRIASLVWRCLSGWAPSSLRELCRPLSSCAGRRTLRSSVPGNLVVPFARSATMQTCSFSVVGPKTWNGLPVDLRHPLNGACSQFRHLLKTVLFRLAWVRSASE